MIERIPFGATGHESTRTIFGGAALWTNDTARADRALDLLLEYDVNHIDTAAGYGESERMIGRWMGRYRDRFFLATKTGDRTAEGAREEFHRSLERLRVDHVDLLQMHCLIDPEEWETAMGPGGALEALIEAQEAGLARFLGVTGHGLTAPAVHRESLERHPFDSILVPYDAPLMQLPDYAASFEELYRLCQERNVAMQTIKAIARRLKEDENDDTHTTWYEPLTAQEDIDRAVFWVFARPGVFLNTAGDVDLLPRILDAASRYRLGTAPSDQEMAAWMTSRKMSPIFSPSDE